MRNALPLVFAISLLAGCGLDSRTDFPTTPGNYVQFYGKVAEIAVVDAKGAIRTELGQFSGGALKGSSDMARARFEFCGLLDFTFVEGSKTEIKSSNMAYGSMKNCQFRPLPARWKLVGHPQD
ncbi:hypothetical protein [Pseudomonas sp. 2FE]|uniref:hypothetical protein n=1 Tax=Pseudomonas sp. 2FE TaxID=2502190 RepID=UPI0010FA0EE7|nr:hypothetical protein [Pseudomonas sp. 2FE]